MMGACPFCDADVYRSSGGVTRSLPAVLATWAHLEHSPACATRAAELGLLPSASSSTR